MTEYNRVYNFSAGPSMLPLPVLEKVRDQLLNHEGSGQSVMEMSHRSAEFKKIARDAEQNLRDLMEIPDNYKVLFVQGGGTLHTGVVDAAGDHRIAMSAAVASVLCGDVTILGAQSVSKSYPAFWEDFVKLGGSVDYIN